MQQNEPPSDTMDQCGLCTFFRSLDGADYGWCLAKGKNISGYNRERCFVPHHLVVRGDRPKGRADIPRLYDPERLPDCPEEHSKGSSDNHLPGVH